MSEPKKTKTAEEAIASHRASPAAPTPHRTRFILTYRASPCPRCAEHGQPRVYRSEEKIRYLVCDRCGGGWKEKREPLPVLAAIESAAARLGRLADQLRSAPRREVHGRPAVLLDAAESDRAAGELEAEAQGLLGLLREAAPERGA